MKKTFLYREYAGANPDLAQTLGDDDELALQDHYETFGRREWRGVALSEYFRVEGVIASDTGHILLLGWADTRIVKDVNMTILVGFEQYELGTPEMCWYHREDVSALTGDTGASGFTTLIHVDDLHTHSFFMILVNGIKVHEEPIMRWLSLESFVEKSLGACAVLRGSPRGYDIGTGQNAVARIPIGLARLSRQPAVHARLCLRTGPAGGAIHHHHPA